MQPITPCVPLYEQHIVTVTIFSVSYTFQAMVFNDLLMVHTEIPGIIQNSLVTTVQNWVNTAYVLFYYRAEGVSPSFKLTLLVQFMYIFYLMFKNLIKFYIYTVYGCRAQLVMCY